ncbi:2-amino-3,7-dideoxy-D-threo-hept-6-ulosonate synthase [Halobacterium sp. MBLA0001]|uniref:2-amino-3,7-dideoxy-D-threo-hept-6-ulosonate synthase n=1 Tax=Halobacterium TaxID=2239 RepID=UPI002553358C|nr:2-amino-3,7-dideoxy-D-threo-hept-6-ulosonate synthase [Halobacterium salinarum]MDL0137075.1 2-amino-3,7-dideoxy-D-threo-hept-6-ulosonate synthase [Halobacterium salinarum]
MTDAGKTARLNRISTDDRLLTIPMDHGITLGAIDGLVDIEATIREVTANGADAVLTQPGIAPRVHPNKGDAGYIVHLNASTALGPDQTDKRRTGTVEDAVRAGADAVSVHINVGSDHEPDQITALADVAADADRLGVPVLAMAYARGPGVDEHDAANLGHAVRLAEEVGADVIKTAYSGSTESFQRVVDATAKPVIIAGGDPAGDRETLQGIRDAMDAGAAGVSTGRTVFQHATPGAMTAAISAVVHDDADPEAALARAGLVVDA